MWFSERRNRPHPLERSVSLFAFAAVSFFIVSLSGAAVALATAPRIVRWVILPDTQYYSARHLDRFFAQTLWIKREAARSHFAGVLGLGDIVDQGSSLRQWRNADAAYRELDGVLPLYLPLGNHDYDAPMQIDVGNSPRTRSARYYAHFFSPSRYQGMPWLESREYLDPAKPENFAAQLDTPLEDGSTAKFLILGLEFAPRNAVLQWADRILFAHPDREVIVLTHSYTFTDDTWVSRCDPHSRDFYHIQDGNDGDEMWNKVLRRHPNVRIILSGHIPNSRNGRRVDLGDQGNLVNSLLADFQSDDFGGNGMLRTMEINLDTQRVDIRTFSPWNNQERSDPRNRFTVDYKAPTAPLPNPQSARLSGRLVPATGPCRSNSAVSGIEIKTDAGRTRTDERGRFELQMPLRQAYERHEIRIGSQSHWATWVANPSPGMVPRTEIRWNGR